MTSAFTISCCENSANYEANLTRNTYQWDPPKRRAFVRLDEENSGRDWAIKLVRRWLLLCEGSVDGAYWSAKAVPNVNILHTTVRRDGSGACVRKGVSKRHSQEMTAGHLCWTMI